MGAGASSMECPDMVTKEQCQAIAGAEYDDALFNLNAQDGKIPKQLLLKLMSSRTDCFLSHDWGNNNGVDNHAKVGVINRALQDRALMTWFDAEQVCAQYNFLLAQHRTACSRHDSK